MSCGVGRRCGLDLALLWLWHRLAAVASLGPLAWEPSYAMGAALEKDKRPKKKKKKTIGGAHLPYTQILYPLGGQPQNLDGRIKSEQKEKWKGELNLPDSKTYYKTTIKTVWYWHTTKQIKETE